MTQRKSSRSIAHWQEAQKSEYRSSFSTRHYARWSNCGSDSPKGGNWSEDERSRSEVSQHLLTRRVERVDNKCFEFQVNSGFMKMSITQTNCKREDDADGAPRKRRKGPPTNACHAAYHHVCHAMIPSRRSNRRMMVSSKRKLVYFMIICYFEVWVE